MRHPIMKEWLGSAVALGFEIKHSPFGSGSISESWDVGNHSLPHPCIARGELSYVTFLDHSVFKLGITTGSEEYFESIYAFVPKHQIANLRSIQPGYRMVLAVEGISREKRFRAHVYHRGSRFVTHAYVQALEYTLWEAWVPTRAETLAEDRLRDAISNYGRFRDAMQFRRPQAYSQLVARAAQGPLIEEVA